MTHEHCMFYTAYDWRLESQPTARAATELPPLKSEILRNKLPRRSFDRLLIDLILVASGGTGPVSFLHYLQAHLHS